MDIQMNYLERNKITEWDSQSHEEIWDWNPFEHFSMMTMIH